MNFFKTIIQSSLWSTCCMALMMTAVVMGPAALISMWIMFG